MDEAFDWCWPRSRPGEAILLSPACASTDQFRNFRHRSEHFVELVRRLANPLHS
jgi:UDP-N-acetylmuramoylalanine--D-glutamate ligase